MARGVRTDAEVQEAFRADYLFTGNAAKSARNVRKLLDVELPARTAADLASALECDEDFALARRQQRAVHLAECAAARQEVLRIALRRTKAKKADVYEFGIDGSAGGSVLDKRPDWAKVVLDAEKNAVLAVKITDAKSGESEPQAPAEVTINIRGPAGTTVTAD